MGIAVKFELTEMNTGVLKVSKARKRIQIKLVVISFC